MGGKGETDIERERERGEEEEGRERGIESERGREYYRTALMHYIEFYFELKTMRSQSNLSNGWINSLCSSPPLL